MLLKKKTRYWDIIWKLAPYGFITFFFELKFIWIFYYQNNMNNFNCNDKQNNLCELWLKKECNTTVRSNLILLKKKTRYWDIIWKLASYGSNTFFFELKFT